MSKWVIHDNKYYCCSTLLAFSNEFPCYESESESEEAIIRIIDKKCNLVGKRIIIPISFCPWCGKKQPLVKDKE